MKEDPSILLLVVNLKYIVPNLIIFLNKMFFFLIHIMFLFDLILNYYMYSLFLFYYSHLEHMPEIIYLDPIFFLLLILVYVYY